MNKDVFLRELAELLNDISIEEKEEAIGYYEAYFDDAGPENEESIIEQLQSPQKIADVIKAGLADEDSVGEFTENGYSDTRFEERNEISKSVKENNNHKGPHISKEAFNKKNSDSGKKTYNDNKYNNNSSKDSHTQDTNQKVLKIILIVVLCIVALPVILPVGFGFIGLIFGFICAVFGLVIAVALTAIALDIAGIIVFAAGIGHIFTNVGIGIAACGAGLIIFAIGILLTLFTILLFATVLPWIFKGISTIWGRIVNNRRGGINNEKNY